MSLISFCFLREQWVQFRWEIMNLHSPNRFTSRRRTRWTLFSRCCAFACPKCRLGGCNYSALGFNQSIQKKPGRYFDFSKRNAYFLASKSQFLGCFFVEKISFLVNFYFSSAYRRRNFYCRKFKIYFESTLIFHFQLPIRYQNRLLTKICALTVAMLKLVDKSKGIC